jgi:hypothetical protein
MKAPLRYILRLALQFFAGLGLFAFCARAYFVVWDNYLPTLSRPYVARHTVDTTDQVILVIEVLFCQLLAYVGMRVLWKSN